MNAKECSAFIAILSLACVSTAVSTPAMSAPAPSVADTERVVEARSIVRKIGDTLWPHWSQTPFVIDLLTPQYETLLNTASIPKGFTKSFGRAAYRKRTFPANLEATFPAFDASPVIVIGEQQLTAAKTPTRWIVTLLHEHFHQWQDGWPAYRGDVNALGLANGDQTGMWMLNYAFPYGSPSTAARFKDLAARLSAAVQAARTPRSDSALQAYLSARAAWRASLSPNDYRYFAFQCWQEGVARYTEYRAAQLAVHAHDAHPTFLTASQARLLKADSQDTYAGIVRELETASLSKTHRVAFYALGAGEALILDGLSPDWHKRYLNPQMDLGIFLGPRRTSFDCSARVVSESPVGRTVQTGVDVFAQ